jgi:hypothetical protein
MDAPRDARWLHDHFHPDHFISRDDLRLYPDAVVDAVNAAPGPQLKRVPGKGYGLFAEKAYRQGSQVTTYGGARVGSTVTGRYVVVFNKRVRIDGEHGFLASEKGRWVNDPQHSMGQSLADIEVIENARLTIVGNTLVFYATRDIEEDEELLWYYGDEYVRDWLEEEDVHSPEDMATSPSSSPRTMTTDEDDATAAEYPPAQLRHETMLEQLRREGADEAYIAKAQQWLAPHGYKLETFNVAAAQRDPALLQMMPRDIRRLLMSAIISVTLEDAPAMPCVAVALIMRLATAMESMAHVLNHDDSVWHRFFVHDFERLGERAPLWTRKRPMPWRSAYLWTVFFRRRCLRELERRREHHETLSSARRQTFGPVPFGLPGCVSVLQVYAQDWSEDTHLRYLQGHATALALRGGGNFVYPPLIGGEEDLESLAGYDVIGGRRVPTNPGRELWRQLSPMHDDDGDGGEGHANMTARHRRLARLWEETLHPSQTGSLAGAAQWNYGGSLYAYCCTQLPIGVPAANQAIFDSLPDEPVLAGRLYLGAAMAPGRTV